MVALKYTYQNHIAVPPSIELEILVEILFAVDGRVGFGEAVAGIELKSWSLVKLNIGPIVEAYSHHVEALMNILDSPHFLTIPGKYETAVIVDPLRRSTTFSRRSRW